MKSKFKLFLVLLFTIQGISYGQDDFRNGFIITLKKDTINGQVDYRSNSKNYESCVFKGEQGVIQYYPDQILGFGYLNDKYFSSQIVEDSFVEVLVTGQLSLYKSKDLYHIHKDTLFFDLESIKETVEINGKRGTRETSRWRGLVTYMISDCLQNFNSLTSDLELADKKLTRLIVKYNKCSGKEFVEFKANKPWTKFDFGATLGISSSEIKIKNNFGAFSYLADSYHTIYPSIGVLIAISSPRITERIAFQGEVQFNRSSYSSLVELESPIEFHDTFIELTTLSVPISIKYSMPEKKYGLYMQGGVNYDYHLSSKTRLLSERASGNVINTFPENSAFEINSNQIGYWGGIGMIKSYKKIKGSIAVRYFQMLSLNKTEGLEANNSRVSLNIILSKK